VPDMRERAYKPNSDKAERSRILLQLHIGVRRAERKMSDNGNKRKAIEFAVDLFVKLID
jgi:hypothetical protein